MIPEIYLIIFLAWLMVTVGLYFKEYTVSVIFSLLLMSLGVYGLINGYNGIDNLSTLALSIVNLALGFFIILAGAIERL